jgi:hypothetical protein
MLDSIPLPASRGLTALSTGAARSDAFGLTIVPVNLGTTRPARHRGSCTAS